MSRTGVFLARMQPLHNAHMLMVEKACKENDKVIVILGSANKKNILRNPFGVELRERLLKEAITDSLGIDYANKIEVYGLPDWTQENDYESNEEWGKYFYYNVVSRANSKTFNIYYSDDPSIMLNWFDEEIKKRISFNFLQRDNIFEGLSATKIRQAFSDNDLNYVKKFCPKCIVDNFDYLRSIWLDILNSPMSDFSME